MTLLPAHRTITFFFLVLVVVLLDRLALTWMDAPLDPKTGWRRDVTVRLERLEHCACAPQGNTLSANFPPIRQSSEPITP